MVPNFIMSKKFIPACLIAAALTPLTVHSVELDVYKFAELGVAGSDNQQFGGNEEFIATVKPSVELSFSGNRFDSKVIAEVEFFRFNEEDFDQIDPRLHLSTSGTLVDNLVYLNSSLDIAKSLPEDDFFDLVEDSETQSNFRFNPFIARQIGRFADLFIGYGHRSLDNEIDGTIDSQQNTFAFSLARNPRFGGFIWGVGGNIDRDDTDGVNFRNDSVYGSLGATIDDIWFFQGLGGVETNNFSELTGGDDRTTFLEASLRWNPSERTSLKVGYSDRFFAEGPVLEFSHRLENSTYSASWTRSITSSEVDLGVISTFNDSISTTTLPGSSVDLIGADGTSDRSVPFVNEQITLGYKVAGRRSDLIVDLLYSLQNELLGESRGEDLIGRIIFDRQLSALTTVRLQYEHRAAIDNADDTSNENRVGVKFIYNFDRKERAEIIEDEGIFGQ